MRRITLMMLTGVFIAGACKGDAAAPAANEIWAKNSAFTPSPRTSNAGAAVTWVNQDGVTHNITSSDVPTGAAPFAQTIGPGATFQLTPTIAGSYQYYCTIHGTPTTGMHGTLSVVVP